MSEAKKASYRLHARRWGVERIARKMKRDGYTLEQALEVLVGRRRVAQAYTA